jgi:hypothetical protein
MMKSWKDFTQKLEFQWLGRWASLVTWKNKSPCQGTFLSVSRYVYVDEKIYSKRRTKVKVKETISSLEIPWPILVCLAFNGWD